MNKTAIREALNTYFINYTKTSATVKGLDIIFKFVKYLKSESYIKDILGDKLMNAEKQANFFISMMKSGQVDNINFPTPNEVVDASTVSDLPWIDKKKFTESLEKVKNNETEDIAESLEPSLFNLLFLYKAIKKAKEKSKNNELTPEMIKDLQAFPMISCRIKISETQIIGGMSGNIFAQCIWVIARTIINEIDTEELFLGSKTKKEPWFDEENTTLHIIGKEIKVAKKHNRSTAHHILQALFTQEKISNEIYFKDVAEELLGLRLIGKEYNSKKDWNRYRNACERLNQDIKNKTEGKIEKFITLHTGKSGSCKINQKYL